MSKKIAVLCEMLYQFDLTLNLAGGGEKFASDFINLLKNLGYEVDVYQFSYEKKTVKYNGITVRGIGNIKTDNYNDDSLAGIKYFHEQAKYHDGIFLLSMNLSRFPAIKATLTIGHGLWWDNRTDMPLNFGINMMDMMKTWVRNSTQCISVDTNSIHAMQLYFPKVAKKMMYIPNYVDLNKFVPKEKDYSGKFKILFPRRVDKARGYLEMAQASKILTEKYDDIEITFCGRGHIQEEKQLHEIIKDLSNVKHISYEANEMYKAYEDALISITPTVSAEGTSLGVLESLATGTVPIVTTIGGLTDIVQPLFNGLMIAPGNVDEIVNAVEYLYHNRDVLKDMRENGLRMIKAFSKERWDSQMTHVIKNLYGDPNE